VLPKLHAATSPKTAVDKLNWAHTEAGNLRGRNLQGSDLLVEYLKWATEATRQLGPCLHPTEINRLIYTQRYWSLQTISQAAAPTITTLVFGELDQRVTALSEAKDELTRAYIVWGARDHVVVLDTSALIHGPFIGELNLAAHCDLPGSADLLVPLVVLDELDGLKESNKEHTRTRARRTLNWFAHNIDGDTHRRHNENGDDITVHLLNEDLDHTRLPIADNEIIDQAVTISLATGRTSFTLYTNDFGQAHRARRSGLRTKIVKEPIYDIDIREAARRAKQQRLSQTRTSTKGPDQVRQNNTG